jgi:hypothetical protein
MCIAQSFPNFRRSVFAVVLLILPFAGCASHGHNHPKMKGEAAAALAPEVRIGSLALVDEKKGFVLIDLGSNLYVPDPGTALRVVRDGLVIAQLKASPEQKRPFIAADILEGNPEVGDLVER